jgi:hypothetical protein
MPSLLSLCCTFALHGAVPPAVIADIVPITDIADSAAPAAAIAAPTADSLRTHNNARNAYRAYLRRATPATARELRPAAIEQLDAAAAVIPGDDWVIGHRVGLRVKQGWATSAVAAALRCEATQWWCKALEGFALHVEGSFADADRAFDEALAAMPEPVRCAWGAELLLILHGPLLAEYAAADCARRIALERRVWWLADPLHVLPGNDRRTEHYSRLVGLRLHREALAATGNEPCAPSHHEAVVRGGWPEWWWGKGLLETGQGGYRFMPSGDAAFQPLTSGPEAWIVAAGGTDERYSPAYGQVRDLEHQVGFFARGDSIIALVAAGLGRTRVGGLVLSRNEDETPVMAKAPEGGGFVMAAMAPRDRYLVSIESVREPSGAARARFGHALPEPSADGLGLSDLLLINWSASLPETLEAVAPRMIGSTRISANRTIGVYWEVYGAADTTAIDVALSAIPEEGGIVQRIGQGLRLVTPRDGVAVRWQDIGDEPGIVRKHLRLDMSQLPPGRYTLQMEVRQGDGAPATARRVIELTGS